MSAASMAKRIELWPIERLNPYENNARTHDEAQVAEIAASIQEFGFNNPILVDGAAGVIAGHGRLLAAQALGMDQVPVVVLDHLSDAQRRAYILADNRIAMNADWDDAVLAAELQHLAQDGFDLTLLGWGEDLPQFAPDLDYTVLERGGTEEGLDPEDREGAGEGDGEGDDDLDREIEELEEGVRRAIQIEFEKEHYDEASDLIKWWRKQGGYVGMMLMDKLRAEKERHEREVA